MATIPMVRVVALEKTFVLHTQGGVRIPVLRDIELSVGQGECVALDGPSGSGKSTLLRTLFANYKPQGGKILVRAGRDGDDGTEVVDLVTAPPHTVLRLRRDLIGYVSQFLRVVPRVPTLDIVAEPLRERGVGAAEATARAAEILSRLNVPERLWSIAPATFSGGEQQRVNVARGLIGQHPILLLDEPTASLDPTNRDVVIELIHEAKARGAAIVGIFHDATARRAVADRVFSMQALGEAA